MDAFATQISDILSWLPNCNRMFFSTNGMAYPERIVELAK